MTPRPLVASSSCRSFYIGFSLRIDRGVLDSSQKFMLCVMRDSYVGTDGMIMQGIEDSERLESHCIHQTLSIYGDWLVSYYYI